MQAASLLTAGLLALCIAMEAARELCFRRAAHGEALRAALLNSYAMTGIACWFVETVAWVAVLEKLPLSVAYPFRALVYVLVVAGGVWMFGERVSRRHALGAVLITAGAALIALKSTI